jgi:CheY-like chemotaxis protein
MKLRVIVLEDDEANRKLITMVLERRGYEVISSSDPAICPIYSNQEGSCPHEDACGDFLLTDNQMPSMTGLDFIEAQNRRGCKGIVKHKAVLSGSWSLAEREKAERLGCKIFSKPYSIAEVSEWLDEQAKQIPPDRKLAALDADPEQDR